MMSSYTTGRQGEQLAQTFLVQRGFRIIDRNWRTRWCEIDIVAKKQQCIYFVEVKRRRHGKWGFAIEYVTPVKLQQMQFAAQLWVAKHNWSDEACLAVVAIDNGRMKLLKLK